MGLVLSGCCVHCQQPVKMLHLMSGTPRFTRERERECVYVCMCVAVCKRKPLSGSCVVLNVASTVSSLSRCSVLSQVPRRERVRVYIYMCVTVCERKP